MEENAAALLEADVLRALTAARTAPATLKARLKERLACYKGKTYTTKDGRSRQTKEGAQACKDAIAYLSKLPEPLGAVEAAGEGLRLAAVDHVLDVGVEGVASHRGTDDSGPSDRNKRYGTWSGAVGECLWYGNASAATGESIVDDLVVDDGVKNRGHRLCIYDARWHIVAVAVGAHSTYANMVALEFAVAFQDDDSLVAARRAAPPPPRTRGVSSRAQGGGTCWDLGVCRGCALPVKGGSVVDVPKLGKWHEACFVCSRCEEPLSGKQTRKKEEGGFLFCAPCHVELYAPECAVCGKKIDGDRINMGNGLYRHPTCKKPAATTTKKKATTTKKKKIGARALAGMYAGLDPGGGAAADAPPPDDDDDREEVLLALPRLPPKGSRRVAPAAAFDSS